MQHYPDSQREYAPADKKILTGHRPYLVLLPVGFTLPAMLPSPRCALTAPFHPYLSSFA